MLKGYVKPECTIGATNADPLRVKVDVPGNVSKVVEPIPESHKAENSRMDPVVKIYDARALQAKYPSATEFYKKYGFCLLQSPTKVKNWNQNHLNPFTDISKIYHKEI